MTLHLHWYLPTNGDGRGIVGSGRAGDSGAGDWDGVDRVPDIEYLGQIARAAEQLGFEAVLTPTGSGCEDAWITTAALSQVTSRLKFLVAFRPGLVSPTLAAQQAQTFQRNSGGRLLLNVVTGGDPGEQRRFGDFLDHDQRYARTAEFLQVLRGASSGRPYDVAGEHLHVEGAKSRTSAWGLPPLFFGGASPAPEAVAAEHVDVYLAWGETPPQLAVRLDRMREKAAAAGNDLRLGVRLHVISRDTAAQAWAEADRLVAGITPERVAQVQADLAKMDSVGQRRMLEEYASLGIEHAILSGQPHLEEA